MLCWCRGNTSVSQTDIAGSIPAQSTSGVATPESKTQYGSIPIGRV
jgi:hypothetical protein